MNVRPQSRPAAGANSTRTAGSSDVRTDQRPSPAKPMYARRPRRRSRRAQNRRPSPSRPAPARGRHGRARATPRRRCVHDRASPGTSSRSALHGAIRPSKSPATDQLDFVSAATPRTAEITSSCSIPCRRRARRESPRWRPGPTPASCACSSATAAPARTRLAGRPGAAGLTGRSQSARGSPAHFVSLMYSTLPFRRPRTKQETMSLAPLGRSHA